jgi:hypothetical protein
MWPRSTSSTGAGESEERKIKHDPAEDPRGTGGLKGTQREEYFLTCLYCQMIIPVAGPALVDTAAQPGVWISLAKKPLILANWR